MKILYLLSDTINYNLLICDDAGPGYAHNMGWECIYLNSIEPIPDQTVIVVDNRIQESELNKLNALLIKYHHLQFFFKIVDPYDYNTTHYYYKFLSKISLYKNACLLSVYEARELTVVLKAEFKDRFIHLPYPYIKDKEIDTIKKKNKVIISGSLNQDVYPYRYNIWKKVTRSVSRLPFFSIIKHPGYRELNTVDNHSPPIIKEAFVKYLSRFKYMLLCPGRCGIEFLKYNECAYAGCVPVGIAPDSYPEDIKDLFIELMPEHLMKHILSIIFRKNNQNVVSDFRDFLNKTRNPMLLNKILNDFILANPVHIF